jgi:hypothetical protein
MHPIASVCKTLQSNYLVFWVCAPNCADEHENEPDPALDPAVFLCRGCSVTV